MNYVVEEWITHEYPSHWSWDAEFVTVDEAIAYAKKQIDPSDFRVIEVLWSIE